MRTPRVAVYARVSTSDKDQNPETQLGPLREFVASQGWILVGEFVDHASATDLRGRSQWQAVLHVASRRKIDLVLVWKLVKAASILGCSFFIGLRTSVRLLFVHFPWHNDSREGGGG
jgi:hypothetical protein